MKATRYPVLLLVAAAMTSACSSVENLVAPTSQYKHVLDARDNAMNQLGQASSCCKDMSAFSYTQIPGNFDQYVVIDGSFPAFNFQEGKSYFAAFQLPQNSGDLRITVASQIDKTLFWPKVIMLDSQFRVTRVIDANIFKYEPARMLSGDRIEGVFTIDRAFIGNPNNETYMIIYTPENRLAESTTIDSPDKQMAKSLSVVPSGAKDPVIPHSPWGMIKLTVEDLSNTSGMTNVFKPVYQDTVLANQTSKQKDDSNPNKLVIRPAAVPAAQQAAQTNAQLAVAPAANTVAAPALAPASAGSMLPETEQMYNQLILKAISGGDIEKAMALATEAERAGSATAKPTLIQAIKKSQK